MTEQIIGVSDWQNTTTLHPIGLISVMVLGCLLLTMPRCYAIVPMIVLACFIPSAQRIVVMGADFSLSRVLVLFAWLRLIARSEFYGFKWNKLDTMVVVWKASASFIYIMAHGTFSAVVFRCGDIFEACGMYFFFRCVLKDWKDLDILIRSFILLSIPVAVAFFIERATLHNVFSIFGGVPETTVIRDGRIRCQGAYSHPILAGAFWVGVMPWMLASFCQGKKWLSGAALLASVTIVINCASSTPLSGLLLVGLGTLLYIARNHLRILRWSFLVLLVMLHLTMQAPVWHLLCRVDLVGGSTGWHRFKILDATINNFSKWWLLGEKSPMSWGVWEMRDVTNQYLMEALTGGLLTLVSFVCVLGVAFGIVGKALGRENRKENLFLVWFVGVSLFVHAGTFFAVSYFGQTIILIYLNLAIIGSLPTITRAFHGRMAI